LFSDAAVGGARNAHVFAKFLGGHVLENAEERFFGNFHVLSNVSYLFHRQLLSHQRKAENDTKGE
jgi:hypothetical protein